MIQMHFSVRISFYSRVCFYFLHVLIPASSVMIRSLVWLSGHQCGYRVTSVVIGSPVWFSGHQCHYQVTSKMVELDGL